MKKNRFDLLLAALVAVCFFSFQGFLLTSEAEARPRVQAAQEDEEEEDVATSDAAEDEEMADEEADADGDGAAAEDEEEEEEDEPDPNAPLAEPEKVHGARLECKDGVQLSATFYPGNRGKKNVPVIILHDWGGTRADLVVLAKELQKNGCSVLIADVRGHGKSINKRIGPENLRTFSANKKMNLDDLQEVIGLDFPCLKKFMMQKNNEGQLNIDKLIIGGVGYGGVAAAFFANADWNPIVKRKKKMPALGDVKGYFIVAPPKPMKGVTFQNSVTFANWGSNISCLILSAGTKNKKVPKSLETALRKLCGPQAMERCWFKNYEQEGEGAELIQKPESDFVLDILAFVDKRGRQRDVLWKSR